MDRRYIQAGRGLRTLAVGQGIALAAAGLGLAVVRGLSVPILLTAAGLFLGAVVEMVGLFRAGKSDGRYRKAFGMTVVYYVASILGRVLSDGTVETIRNGVSNDQVSNDHRLEGALLSAAGWCLLLWAVFLVCRTTSQLLRERGEETWASVGEWTWRLRLLIGGIGLIQRNLPVGGEGLRMVRSLAGIGGSVLYLVFCGQSARLLLAGGVGNE